MTAGPDLDVLFRRGNYRPPVVREAQPLAPWLGDPVLRQQQLRASRARQKAADLRAQFEANRMPSSLRAEARAIRRRTRQRQEHMAGVVSSPRRSVSRSAVTLGGRRRAASLERCAKCTGAYRDCEFCGARVL